MRFARAFDSREVLQGIRRLRANVVLTYVIAIGVVALATLLRFAIQAELPHALPITTYSLALIVAAVLGGFWPGMVALFFATIGAWYLFFSPTFGFALAPREMWALILFVGVGMVNITLLSALVASVLARDEHQQFLMRELQHRSLNLFSMIQAIASRSLVDGQPLSKAKELFTGRVAALARTHGHVGEKRMVRSVTQRNYPARIGRVPEPDKCQRLRFPDQYACGATLCADNP